jgi:hypothetical protein
LARILPCPRVDEPDGGGRGFDGRDQGRKGDWDGGYGSKISSISFPKSLAMRNASGRLGS